MQPRTDAVGKWQNGVHWYKSLEEIIELIVSPSTLLCDGINNYTLTAANFDHDLIRII